MQFFQAAKWLCHPSQGIVTNSRAFRLLGWEQQSAHELSMTIDWRLYRNRGVRAVVK
jgi:hypothetical protein